MAAPASFLRFEVPALRVAATLLCAATALVGAHVLLSALRFFWFPESPLYGLPRLFNLSQEGNLPTYFSALCLLFAALLLTVISAADSSRDRAYWRGLALGFFFLSVDEAAQIHDSILNPSMKSVFGGFESRFLFYGWVVPALIGIVVVALAYSRFLWRLPRRFALLFVVAGCVYVGAAVGLEMVESARKVDGIAGGGWVSWRAIGEEGGEMLGAILFVYALLAYMEFRDIRPGLARGPRQA